MEASFVKRMAKHKDTPCPNDSTIHNGKKLRLRGSGEIFLCGKR
jgi:hypothetical protein